MYNVSDIVHEFGGLTKMSQATNIPISTIQSWEKAGNIPHWRHDVVIKAADENNILLPNEFYTGGEVQPNDFYKGE